MNEKKKLQTATRALKHISKMMGTFTEDPKKHAENVITENQIIAILALKKIGETIPEEDTISEEEINRIAENRELHEILEEEK